MICNQRDALAFPDGFIGAVFAIEGIVDAAAIVNAPTGCKFFMARTLELQYPREFDYSQMRYAEEYFFGQARLPCTYLDDYDYVFGSSQKLEYVFGRVADKGYRFLGVLNSPGAALIGDDLDRYLAWSKIDVPAIVIDKPDFGRSFAQGWSAAVRQTLERLAPAPADPEPRRVNLIGISIWEKDWEQSVAELQRLLRACGVTVQAVLCAGSPVEAIQGLRRACCNVVVHDELGRDVGEWMQAAYGMPMVRSEEGAPFGYDALELWLRAVCDAAQVDPGPGLDLVWQSKQRACSKLMEFSLDTGLPKGATLGVCLDASLALPAVKWCHAYLGMVPVAVQVPDETEPLARKLKTYLEDNGLGNAWNAELDSGNPPHAVLSNDAVLRRLMAQEKLHAGVALAMPDAGMTEFVPRSVLGAWGPLWALDQLATGLWALVE